MKANEGDIVIIDESLEYKFYTQRYKALIIYNNFNNQPLITRLDEWRPIWSSYNQIAEIIGHIDLNDVLREVNADDRNL